jgi:hypothetical protein
MGVLKSYRTARAQAGLFVFKGSIVTGKDRRVADITVDITETKRAGLVEFASNTPKAKAWMEFNYHDPLTFQSPGEDEKAAEFRQSARAAHNFVIAPPA